MEWQKPFGELVKAGIAKKGSGGGPTNCKRLNSNGSRPDLLLRTLIAVPGPVEMPVIRALKGRTWKEEVNLIAKELAKVA